MQGFINDSHGEVLLSQGLIIDSHGEVSLNVYAIRQCSKITKRV